MRRRFSLLIHREFSIAEASLLLLCAYLGSAMLGAVRQVLLSARFGAGDELSAYLAAARLPDTLFTLVAGGVLTNAMVPVLIAARKGTASQLLRVVELTLTALMLAVVVLIGIGMLFAPWLVRTVLAPGFDEPTAELTTQLTRLLLLQPLLLAGASVATALLNSRARFFLPALAIVVQNFAEIGGILVTWVWTSLGVWGPAFGVIGGVLLQAVVLLPALRQPGSWPRFRWDPHDPDLRLIVALLVPNALLIGSSYLGGLVETAFASLDANKRAIPALANAWLLVGLPVRLIGTAAAQAAFPRLTSDAVARNWGAFRPRLRNTAGIVFCIAALGVPAFLILGRFLVRLVFEHGEYTAADGDLTYSLVVAFVWGLPFFAVTEVLTRGLLALHDTRSPLFTNVGQLLIRIVVIWICIDRWGLTVIPWSLSATAIIEMLILAWLLRWRVNRLDR